jgi:hypothetical protein
MTETEIQHTAEAASETVTEPVTEPASDPMGSGPHNDEDRLEHAKNSLIHAVETAVGKFTDTLGITGRK